MKLFPRSLLQEKYLIPLKIVSVYLVWRVFLHFASVPGSGLNRFWLSFTYDVGCFYAKLTFLLLSSLGMNVSATGIAVDLINSRNVVLVQDHCLAIPAMVIFVGSVVFFRGTYRDKLPFLLIGLAGIVLINALRLVFVALALIYLPPFYFVINHSYAYVFLTYSFIFFMITRWMDMVTARTDTPDDGTGSSTNSPGSQKKNNDH